MTPRQCPLLALALTVLLAGADGSARAADPWIVYDGYDGPGKGKHIVLISGDEEYRSEELIPQLAKVLAKHHGFKCTVLFAIDRKDGTINPQQLDNIPGLEALDHADLMVLFTRFRDLPDDQMKHIVDYINSGKPIVALRTATHAFNFKNHKTYARYNYNSKDPKGGFGRQVLGETWVSHYGAHQKQSTRGLIAEGQEKNPIVKGCADVWGPSDVYGLTTLEGDCKPVIMGQVLEGMKPTDKPAAGKKLVPIAWTKTFTGDKGKAARVFTTTMGHGGDLQSEGFRRLLVNACYWVVGLEEKIPDKADVALVGEYKPNNIGVGGHKKGLKPDDYRIK
jgi:type 1 glutamine amidotransferase